MLPVQQIAQIAGADMLRHLSDGFGQIVCGLVVIAALMRQIAEVKKDTSL